MISASLKGSLGTLVRDVPCDLKVTGSSRGIGHWKQVRPPTIYPSGCGPFPDPAYAGCFVHRAALYDISFVLYMSNKFVKKMLSISISYVYIDLVWGQVNLGCLMSISCRI